MFSKRTVVLKKDGGAELLPAEIEIRSNSLKILIKIEGTALLSYDDRSIILPIKGGECCFSKEVKGAFAVAVDTEKGFYVYPTDLSYSVKKAMEQALKNNRADERNINLPYDDEAIAVENYYLNSAEIKAVLPENMRDKWHLINEEEKDLNQHSTIYPHCVQTVKEVNNYEKGDIYEKAAGCKENEGNKLEEEACPPCACQNEERVGSCREGEKNRRSVDRQALVASTLKMHGLCLNYPRVRELERAVDGSVFLQIDGTGERPYVTGMTVKNGLAEYFIFGIPATEKTPPEGFEGSYFVPTPSGGYHLIFQNA